MKKYVSVIFIAILLTVVFCGCEKSNNSKENGFDENVSEYSESKTIDTESETQEVFEPSSAEKDELYFDNYPIRWGMSAEEITETLYTYKNYHDYGSKIKGESSYYLYKDHLGNSLFHINEYMFWMHKTANKLYGYVVDISEIGINSKNYDLILCALKDKYGEPDEENYNFSDKTYEDDIDKSLKYDYLTIQSKWKNNDEFDLLLYFSKNTGWIVYCEKGLMSEFVSDQ